MANNFGLFFTRDSTVIRLPVNPAKLPVERDNDNQSYNVLGIGPITAPRIPKPREVKISSFFPGRPESYVLTAGDFREPEFYISFFQSAMDDRAAILYTPVRYYEDGTPFMTGDTGFPVLVSSFSTEERGGETGDFYYDLTLTEYRDYSPQTVAVQPRQESAPDQAAPLTATPEVSREIPSGQLYVGCTCIANGSWYYTSYGEEPHGDGNGRRVVVGRIIETDPTRQKPVLVKTEQGGLLGWMSKDALQVVSGP